MFEQCNNHRQPTDLVVTVKTAKEPNTRIKSDLGKPTHIEEGKLNVRIDTTGIRLLRRGFGNL